MSVVGRIGPARPVTLPPHPPRTFWQFRSQYHSTPQRPHFFVAPGLSQLAQRCEPSSSALPLVSLALSFGAAATKARGKTEDKTKDKKDDGGHRCANCDKPGATKKCGRCGVEWYCDRECQKVSRGGGGQVGLA